MKKYVVLVFLFILSACVNLGTWGKKTYHCTYGQIYELIVRDEFDNMIGWENIPVDLSLTYHAQDDFIYQTETIMTLALKDIDDTLLDDPLKIYHNLLKEDSLQLETDGNTTFNLNETQLIFNTITHFNKKEGFLYRVGPYNQQSLSYITKMFGDFNHEQCHFVD